VKGGGGGKAEKKKKPKGGKMGRHKLGDPKKINQRTTEKGKRQCDSRIPKVRLDPESDRMAKRDNSKGGGGLEEGSGVAQPGLNLKKRQKKPREYAPAVGGGGRGRERKLRN